MDDISPMPAITPIIPGYMTINKEKYFYESEFGGVKFYN